MYVVMYRRTYARTQHVLQQKFDRDLRYVAQLVTNNDELKLVSSRTDLINIILSRWSIITITRRTRQFTVYYPVCSILIQVVQMQIPIFINFVLLLTIVSRVLFNE